MSECSVADGPEAKQKGNSTNFNFTVKNSRDTYILTAKTEQEKQEWIDILKDANRFTKRSAKERRRTAALDKVCRCKVLAKLFNRTSFQKRRDFSQRRDRKDGSFSKIVF